MGSICSKLTEIVAAAFHENGLDPAFGLVVESQRPDLGQFQCNGALPAAKTVKQNPRALAEKISTSCKNNPLIADIAIAGPGFLNITVTDVFLAAHTSELLSDPHLGCSMGDTGKTVIIDFGSPNIAKPMHVGHLRSAIIGDSLQRLFAFLEYRVISDNHVGDWGTQMGMLIAEWRRRDPQSIYFNTEWDGPYPEQPPLTITDLEEMYPFASKRCKADDAAMAEALVATEELQKGRRGYLALWKHFVALSCETLKTDFDNLGIKFDHWLGESFYTDHMGVLVERLKQEGHAVISEGALVIPVTRNNDTTEVPPVMLVKSGGGYLYATSDIATIDYRITTFKADMILYVVDQRQHLHFEQVFRAARKTGIVSPETILEHIGFGTVNGPDGKPFKTRDGGVMKLNDLIEQVTGKAQERMKEAGIAQELDADEQNAIARKVGIAALKFADLANHRTSNYIFDIDKFTTFEGKTGPYLLYTAVRIKSILRKTEAQGVCAGPLKPPTDGDRRLALVLCQLPDMVRNTAEGYAPNYLCDFAYTLAQEFNRFYNECHILREIDTEKQGSWLTLATLCLRELEMILGLLGIEVPERM